ncbi:hypothetical protein CC117_27145 [Parafrankia colletiae]|uniref:ABC transporter domain-containing protein n=1 Tax=Parafrankia colletiae TaxID=573497 RepID=A0A1S1QD04_9ACTN|nr:hypothetical protein CC117_27145 [Parafrankia colletiae]
MSPGREVVLDIDALSARLPTAQGFVTVVDGVSLRLTAGETLGVVGESGSGKSMLVRTVMDVLPPGSRTAGTVRLAGTNLGHGSWNKGRHLRGSRLTMVFQDSLSNLNPVRTIGAQLTDPLRHHLGLSRRAARVRARELLELVQLTEPARRLREYPHELSGGMRQRVMLATALACRPDVLIADEPTTALDVTVQRQILDLLTRLRRELDMAVLLISHDLSVVRGRTDRVAVMYAGEIVESAPTEMLFTHPRHPYTRALLQARLRLDLPRDTPLATIAGVPASLADPPAGCRFAPRCPSARPRCAERPRLTAMPGDAATPHLAACWFPDEAAGDLPAGPAWDGDVPAGAGRACDATSGVT